MDINVVLNVVLGGGLIATLLGLFTLKSSIKKAKTDAVKAEYEAETVQITNVDSATRILVANIVTPLKEELNAVRNDLKETNKELGATKREMARLRKAVNDATACRYSADCPVLSRLRESSHSDDTTDESGQHNRQDGQQRDDNAHCIQGDSTSRGSVSDHDAIRDSRTAHWGWISDTERALIGLCTGRR